MTDEKRAADKVLFETFFEHLRKRLEQIGRLSILTLEYYLTQVETRPNKLIANINKKNRNPEYLNANIVPWFVQMDEDYDALFEAIYERDHDAINEVLQKGLNVNSAHDWEDDRCTPYDYALSLYKNSDTDEDVMEMIDFLELWGADKHFYMADDSDDDDDEDDE